jgi:hypothetical protein
LVYFRHLLGAPSGLAARLSQARIDVHGALVIFTPAVEKREGFFGVSGAVPIHQFVQINPCVAHPGIRAVSLFGIALTGQPAFGDVIRAGITSELFPVEVVAAKKQGDAVVNTREVQGNILRLNPHCSAAAHPIAYDDAIPIARSRCLLNGRLQPLTQLVGVFVQPPGQKLGFHGKLQLSGSFFDVPGQYATGNDVDSFHGHF